MNKFESVLLNYGAKVLIDVRNLAEELEWFEDCAEINKVLAKYNIKTTFNLGDWRNEFWKMGCSGEVAISNLSIYYYKAVISIYGDSIFESINMKHENIRRI